MLDNASCCSLLSDCDDVRDYYVHLGSRTKVHASVVTMISNSVML
jgi:hypothetical protein